MTCVLVDDSEFGETADDDLVFAACGVGVGDAAELVDFDDAGVFGLDGALGGVATCYAALVECSERELCARLADGLRGDDADGFALVDEAARGEVSAVALGANALSAFAGEYGAYLDALDG